MNNFGSALEDYVSKPDKCTLKLSAHLNDGSLSLMLGAGASKGFGLPNWKDLVISCVLNDNPKYKIKKNYTNNELKVLMDNVKKSRSSTYITLIKDNLYQGVNFDFSTANKDLLIAITSLIIGRSRGNVSKIFTYNFDNVLEWFLQINGIKSKVITFENLLISRADVDIIHYHGYIPFTEGYGDASTEVVFSKKEYEDRQIGSSYWKEIMYEFFRQNVFLTIGLSPNSLLDDICPYLRELNNWYASQSISRNNPYGVAFIVPEKESKNFIKDCISELVEVGIIPCIMEIPQIAPAIFNIAQKSLNNI